MWPDRVSNPGPLTYESGALPTALRGPGLSLAPGWKRTGQLDHIAGLLPLKVYSFAKLVTKLYCNVHVPDINVDQFADVHVHVFVNNILTY